MNNDPGLVRSGMLSIVAAFFGFFIMGFVDVVGIATHYIRQDFSLSAALAGLLPMMVFLWFAIFSIPTGILMGRIGRKNTVLLGLLLTAVAMFVPYLAYNFPAVLMAFIVLGISNTILQVALNPLVAAMFSKQKTAGMLTMGQFIKAVASFLGPIIAGFAASRFGDWKLIFLVFGITTLVSAALLLMARVKESGFDNAPASFAGALGLLKDRFILLCFLCIFLIVGFDVGMNVSIPELLMKQGGLDVENAGYGNSIYFAARTLGSFLGAFLLLKVKPVQYQILTLIVAVVAYLALMFATDVWVLRILIFILGFACANVFSIIFSFALQHSPARANEISALMIMGVAGGAVIPFLQGILQDNLGYIAALSVIFICLALMLLITFNLKKNVPEG